MAADLGLVVDAAEARARNLSPSERAMLCPSDVLPTPGGPTKHRIGLRPSRIELTHGQVLDYALLDLLEAVVVRVEDARARAMSIDSSSSFDHGSATSVSR